MIERLPSGTRDVLPDEMRELRAVTERIREVFERAGFGEVYTPALEYDRGNGTSAYRMFDEHGNVLVLRSDMTVPIARLAGSKYATAEPPLRFCYFAHAYRSVRPQRGQSREFLQAGVELLGAPSPEGTAEALTVLGDVLDAVGLENYRIGLGHMSLYPTLLESLGVPEEQRARVLADLTQGDFVAVRRDVDSLSLSASDTELLLRVPRMRGGPEILDDLEGPLHDAGEGLRSVLALLAPRTVERVIVDLGLVQRLGYYTGAIFQVYDPAYGMALGGGGRYDDLLGEFGRPLPAVGFALNVERLHIALAGEERGRG